MPRAALLALATALALAGAPAAPPAGAASAAPVAREQTLAATPPGSEEPWLLHAEGPRARVERDGRAAAGFALPPGSVVSAFVAGKDLWAAAATVVRPDGGDLALWTGDELAARPLPALPPRRGALRHDPLPLLSHGQLAGVAWLEGDAMDRLAVWSARWNGKAWREVAPVAPAGPGSQLALTGAVLADGSWLLAWSAFDGKADEVVWTRRAAGAGAAWSEPRPLPGGAGVPDITPALRADGSGALLAWSRFDGGEYRLLLSRFTGGSWSAPEWAAEPGTMLPTWEGEVLLFRDGRNAAWVAGAVAGARLAPLAARGGGPGERPLLLRQAGEWRLQPPRETAPRPR